ncbi:CDC27 family protein [Kitasatospora sp. NBC_01250]|uniref:CDC27 family protein n=1 Tax=unclassified Kitasatospora TaxID=2633591 RepID=UPI002E0D9DB9|nr:MULTISPECIES: CDC27 family protein [unclassified Kitasatospora]WSJ69814.1 CDC27 family protein [Kitasatospora sp. NBC_01302]
MTLRLDTAFAELALRNGGDAEALAVFVRVLAADPPPDPATARRARRGRAWALEKLGRLEAAIGAYRDLLAEPGTEVGSADWALLSMALCRCYRDVGDQAMSVDVGERALRELRLRRPALLDEHLQLGSTLTSCYVQRGDLVSARLLAERLLPLAGSTGSRETRGALEWNASLIARELGRYHEALELAERALVLMAETDNARHQGLLRCDLALVLVARGEPARAAQLLPAAYEILRDSAGVGEVVFCVALLAEVLVQLGDPEAALEWAERGVLLVEATGEDLAHERAALALAFGRAHLAGGEAALGEAELLRCGMLLARAGEHRSVALLWRRLGDSWAEREQTGLAMAAYRTALTVLGLPAAAPVTGRRQAGS